MCVCGGVDVYESEEVADTGSKIRGELEPPEARNSRVRPARVGQGRVKARGYQRELRANRAAIRLIGRRGQQGSIDGSIALSIRRPDRARVFSAGRAASELLREAQRTCINAGKSIRSLMLIYARTPSPRQPF